MFRHRLGVKVLLNLLWFLAALPIAAAEKRVILLQSMDVPVIINHSRLFIESLERQGFIHGENMDLTILMAKGDVDFARKLLTREIDRQRPDMVVTSATLASKVAREILPQHNIPHLFMTVTDPVGAGLVEDLVSPREIPITGKIYFVPAQVKLATVQRILGDHGPIRIGYIHSNYPAPISDLKRLQQAAEEIDNIKFVPYQFPYQGQKSGFDPFLEGARQGIMKLEEHVDYWWEPRGPLGESDQFFKLLRQSSTHPILFASRMDHVKQGALTLLYPQKEATAQDTAQLARSILLGKDAGQIPITAASKNEMGINLATAHQLKLIIPSDLLKLARENLFHTNTLTQP